MSDRLTSQRDAIERTIRDATGPLRPHEILELASPTVPRLGIATVYRQLRRLQDAGEVTVVDLGVNDARYEPANRGHHHHFLCRECDEAFDVPGCPEGITKLAPPGFEVDEHEITLYGRCDECSAAK